MRHGTRVGCRQVARMLGVVGCDAAPAGGRGCAVCRTPFGAHSILRHRRIATRGRPRRVPSDSSSPCRERVCMDGVRFRIRLSGAPVFRLSSRSGGCRGARVLHQPGCHVRPRCPERAVAVLLGEAGSREGSRPDRILCSGPLAALHRRRHIRLVGTAVRCVALASAPDPDASNSPQCSFWGHRRDVGGSCAPHSGSRSRVRRPRSRHIHGHDSR